MTPEPPIYLDHNATTPVDARVLDAMLPYFRDVAANASSTHAPGRAAAEAVDAARRQVAELIHADPREVVFTSGATEANNLAIKGVVGWYGNRDDAPNYRGRHVVTASTEHTAVLDVCGRLVEQGCEVTYVDPAPTGVIEPATVADAVRDDTVLVSVMWVNNETGVINDIAAIAAAVRDRLGRHVLVHTDATQAVGRVPVDVAAAHVDLLSCSAHKLYGPKGVGALYVRRRDPRVRLTPLIDGGGHERGVRSGTLNVPGVVGFGAACALCAQTMRHDMARIADLRDRLEAALIARLGDDRVRVIAAEAPRVPNTANVAFAGVDADRLLRATPGIAASTGAACSAANWQGSHVLRRMGLDDAVARSAVRLSLGRDTTPHQITRSVELMTRTLATADVSTPACG
ncbi:MAG: aminotransferase class V-fold PLP-dependent enzyme [Phycisphaera sp.]|nr:aminotransferase class V-fold PLP-dependent enzyme [Phycisphaera sp.]